MNFLCTYRLKYVYLQGCTTMDQIHSSLIVAILRATLGHIMVLKTKKPTSKMSLTHTPSPSKARRLMVFAIGLALLLLASPRAAAQDTICQEVVCASSLPYTWHGHTFTLADSTSTVGGYVELTHIDTLTNVLGNDSIVLLELILLPAYEVYDTFIVCPGMPYTYHGIDYGGPTEVDLMLLTDYDCDSLVHLVLRPRDTAFHIETYYRTADDGRQTLDSIILGCAPTTITFSDSTAGALSRLWSFTSADTSLTSTLPDFAQHFEQHSDSVLAVVSLIVESEGHCFDTLAWPVIILPRPTAAYVWQPEMPALHNPEVQLLNRSRADGPLTYLWQIGAPSGGEPDTSTAINPLYSWGTTADAIFGDANIDLIAYWEHTVSALPYDSWATDSLLAMLQVPLDSIQLPIFHTCPDTASDTITIINDYLQFPNLVTPNGDGNNDTWRIVNLVDIGFYPTNELWIYNRWGQLVFHSRNISTDTDFWDPNSTQSPDGTYFYRFLAKSPFGAVKQNGVIEVLRD